MTSKKRRQRGSDDGPRTRMLEYLAARGVDEKCAERARLEALDAAETKKLAGKLAQGRTSFRIPFHDLDGKRREFARLNFAGQKPVGGFPTNEKPIKTWQSPKTPPELYLPPVPPGMRATWREVANDTSVDLILTEGEVKGLAASHRGFVTVAALGVENWHEAGDADRLVEGLREFQWRGRRVFLVFDSDAATNPNVQKAEEKVKDALTRRGALPHVVRLPPPTDGRKSQGLDDFLVAQGADALGKLLGNVERLPDALDSGDALFDTEFPPVEFAVFPYLPKRELVELHGAHGQFKSTLMLNAALAIATGEPWHGGGRSTRQGRAVFISLEDASATLATRVRAWLKGSVGANRKLADDGSRVDQKHSKRDPKKLEQALRKNFQFLCREKAGPLVLTANDYGQVQVQTTVVERLVKLCGPTSRHESAADLVVVETAARLNPCGETNEALAVLAGALERVATATGACIVLVRHVSKERATNGQVDSYAGRGGGALADAARGVLSVTRDGDGPFDPVRIVHTKSTHTERGPDLAWRPEKSGESVYLRPLTADEALASKVRAGDERLVEKIRVAGPEGITHRQLHQKLPNKGKAQRAKALEELNASLARLVESKLIVEPKPKTYCAAEFAAGGVQPDEGNQPAKKPTRSRTR